MSGEKMESCSRMQEGNERLALGENEVRKISKDYVEDIYNIDTQGQVVVHICVFDGVKKGKV